MNNWSGELDFKTLHTLYHTQSLRPSELVQTLYARIAHCTTPNIWIHLLPFDEVMAQAQNLENYTPSDLPLYGIPYAVKDNIDVAGHPTTAACPEFSYIPSESATVVKQLQQAGALLLGKTNLDQFATGLVGTRSPYGICANPRNQDYIAGGSSSGSAVAVAAHLVSFALGTDTAGSGRVPAGFNNIVGLKPTKGLLSTWGVVPACRSLDCVSIFALNCADAQTVLTVCQGYDPADSFSRPAPPLSPQQFPPNFRFGIPNQLEFFGNVHYETLYQAAINRLITLGGQPQPVDFTVFRQTAQLLYDGPWVVERLATLQNFISQHPQALLPVIDHIINGARRFSAVEVYEGYYRLKAYQQQLAPLWEQLDCLVVPTSGTIYTVAEIEANPIALNTNLGYYTNFVNLLDLCALALPNGFQPNGLPMGITLIAPAFHEAYLGQIGAAFEQNLHETYIKLA